MIFNTFWLLGYSCFGSLLFVGGFIVAKTIGKRTFGEALGWGVIAFLVIPVLHGLAHVARGAEAVTEISEVATTESEHGDGNKGSAHHDPRHPLHPHHDQHVKPPLAPHGGHIGPRPLPERERFHPVRRLFRSGVEFTCGMLGVPSLFVRFIGMIEVCGLICVLGFAGAVVLGFGYVGLKVVGVIR